MDIRWQLQFVSLNGIGCLVNIYDDELPQPATPSTRTGADVPFQVAEGVTELTGCADPFNFSEDQDEDLLNVFRVKTGYLNVLENEYGELDDLQPPRPFSRKVECYYGSTLVFDGYLQQQSFENDYAAAPRELQFPVVSKLGAIENVSVAIPSQVQQRDADDVSLALYLSANMQTDAARWAEAIYPEVGYLMQSTIRLGVLKEKNSDFTHSPQNTAPTYVYKTVGEFLRGLCNAYGWMIHDTPSRLVFSRFNYNDAYVYNTGATYPTRGDDTEQLEDVLDISSADCSVQNVLPLRKLTLNFQNQRPTSQGLDFSLTTTKHSIRYGGLSGSGSNKKVDTASSFFCVSLDDVEDSCVSSPAIQRNNDFQWDSYLSNQYMLTQDGVTLVHFDTGSNYGYSGDAIVYQDRQAAPTFSSPITIYFDAHPPIVAFNPVLNSLLDWPTSLKISARIGARLTNLVNSGTSWSMKVTIYAGRDTIITQQTVNVVNGECEVYFPRETGGEEYLLGYNQPMRVVLSDFVVPNTAYKIIMFSNISFERQNAPADEYMSPQKTQSEIEGSDQSEETATVNLLFNQDALGTNYITSNYHMARSYDYMFQPQERLKLDMRGTLPDDIYLKKFTFSGKKYRVVSVSFYPRDDEYQLTLHHSPLL